MSKKILVVAAHPDDEVIGCAGTIKKFTDSGNEVHLIVGSDGVSSRNTNKSEYIKRNEALENSCEFLKINKIYKLQLPDNQMDTIPLLKITQDIEKVIQEYLPEIVFVNHYGDLNIDHQIIHRATLTACRPQPNLCVKQIYSYEVMSSTDYQTDNSIKFMPNTFFDISDVIEIKKESLKIYDKEMRKYPHSRSIENIVNNAKVRGASVGLKYAEAFIQLRKIQ